MQMRKVKNSDSDAGLRIPIGWDHTASSLNSIAHIHPYLLYISQAVFLNEHEQDVSIVSGLFECVCTVRTHVPVFILVPLQEHEVDPKLKKMCFSFP